MAKVTYQCFDVRRYLDTAESVEEYLALALEKADAKTIQLVLRDVASAYGMSELAKKTALNRESLYKALSATGNPSFANILKIANALDLKFALTHA